MTLRRKFALLALPALPMLALRFYEALSGAVETPSGFMAGGFRWYHPLQLAVAAALAILASAWVRRGPPPRGGVRPDAVSRALLGVSALGAAAASACQLAETLAKHPAQQFFMSSAQLTALGVYDGGFRLAAICAAVGFLAAVWLALAAAMGDKVRGGAWLSMAPAVWFALRAVVCFARGPVNSNDTVTVAEIVQLMTLAAAYSAYARSETIDPSPAAAARCAAPALACLYGAAFSLPGAAVRLFAGSTADALHIVAAALAAAAVFARALGRLSNEVEVKDAQ